MVKLLKPCHSCSGQCRADSIAFLAMLSVLLCTAHSSQGAAVTQPSAATGEDAPQLLIGNFKVRYFRDRPDLPTTREILDHTTFNLRKVDGGFAGPAAGATVEIHHFNDDATHNARFSESAIKYVQEGVRNYMSSRGLIAIFVYAADQAAADTPDGPDALLADYSKLAGNTKPVDVQMVIVVGIVGQVRAITSTDKAAIPFFPSTIAKAERQIKANSPAKIGDPMYGDPLQDYLAQLNRRPGRHVDISLSSADPNNEDAVALDYLIHMAKPWSVYTSVQNTGTRETNEWQERFGFIDNELTGNDDILALDYDTSSFADNYSFTGSYDFPILNSQTVRGRVYGAFGKFNSSDLGLIGESLNGDSSEVGFETAVNVFQYHQLFVDMVAGARVDNYSVGVKVPALSGKPSNADAAFLFPYVGARVSRATDVAVTQGQVLVLFNPQTPSSANDRTLNELGRLDVNKNYTIIQAGGSESFYIEPLFSNWENRDRNSRPVAANEMYFSAQGQYTMGDKRLVPELEGTAGGLYSVRGYPDSVVAGDTVIYGTAEYRLHIPRLLGVAGPNTLWGRSVPPPPLMGAGGGFNYQPRAADTPGDWDMIFRTFVDAGYVHFNKINLEQAGTSDAGLVSTGCGLELRLRDNVTIRADYGWPLTPIHEAVGSKNELDILPGQGRFNFVFTLLY